MATLQKDIIRSSQWLVKTFKELNIKLDYSPESVKFIDALLDEQFVDGKPKDNGLFASGFGGKIFAVGSYIGEVIIRHTQAAKWITNYDDEESEVDIQLFLVSGATLWPIQRAIKRVKNGREDDLYFYVRLAITDCLNHKGEIPSDFGGVKPEKRKRWWKRSRCLC